MSAAAPEPEPPPIFLWLLIPAAVGFAAGFFGTIIFSPDANQGPLLGIFITGPGGAALGLALGLVVRILRLLPGPQWTVLTATCAVIFVGALLLSFPEPSIEGYVIDGEIVHCTPPVQVIDRAVEHWEKVAGVSARAGWQADALRSASLDAGVVLELREVRRLAVYRHRKPWDRGRITTRLRSDTTETRRYYARYAGGACEAYPPEVRTLYFAQSGSVPRSGPREWPPTSDVAAFLGLNVLVPVPEELQRRVQAPRAR